MSGDEEREKRRAEIIAQSTPIALPNDSDIGDAFFALGAGLAEFIDRYEKARDEPHYTLVQVVETGEVGKRWCRNRVTANAWQAYIRRNPGWRSGQLRPYGIRLIRAVEGGKE
jgi:hypothetical protein